MLSSTILLLALAAFGVWIVVRRPRGGAVLVVHPKYRDLLRINGLVAIGDFLARPAFHVSGHPERHVARLELNDPENRPIVAFLKREQCIRWRDRLDSAMAGLGWVSRSLREAQLVDAARRDGLACPEVLAAGEDGRGQAFLLLREIENSLDLHRFLDSHYDVSIRRRLAVQIGKFLGLLHQLGWCFRDLYAKHLLVRPDNLQLALIDWQRARCKGCARMSERQRDLVTLLASLRDGSQSDAVAVALGIRAYLRTFAGCRIVSRREEQLWRGQLTRWRSSLRQRRAGRHFRRSAEGDGRPKLLQVGTRDLFVTQRLVEQCTETLPTWLADLPRVAEPVSNRLDLVLDGRKAVLLVQVEPRFPNVWRRREAWRLAALVLRLECLGIPAPRLLAIGRAHRSWRHRRVFTLLEVPGEFAPLEAWLDGEPQLSPRRREVARQAAALLQRLHDAGLLLAPPTRCLGALQMFGVGDAKDDNPIVAILDVSYLRQCRSAGKTVLRRDFDNCTASLLERLTPAEQLFVRAMYEVGTKVAGPGDLLSALSATVPVSCLADSAGAPAECLCSKLSSDERGA
jgi:tRNA A-37 threonylcarbamoyl transferase component Bud32